LEEANEAIEDLEEFYGRVENDWGRPEQRIIGHTRNTPAVSFNVGRSVFTEDWGAFELDDSKFKDAFRGNFIDFGALRFIMLLAPGHLTIGLRDGD
jgi:hypothetical protein